MDTTERQVIDDLFEKLRKVESQTAPRDREAEEHILRQIARQPAAPYYMAQTIVMQEQALTAATARIEEMEREREARPASGGFLGGLFGGGQAPTSDRRAPAAVGDPRLAAYARRGRGAGPWGGGGNGFLAGAMQTAVGVAGGMMLASALGSMFGADEAAAAEPDPAAEPAAEDDLSGGGDVGADDGGDFGGFDDF